MRRALLVLAAVPAVIVSGCGATIKADGAAKSVVDVVSHQTGFKPNDVTCPSGVDAEVGVEFDCKFTGPEGKEYTAHSPGPADRQTTSRPRGYKWMNWHDTLD